MQCLRIAAYHCRHVRDQMVQTCSANQREGAARTDPRAQFRDACHHGGDCGLLKHLIAALGLAFYVDLSGYNIHYVARDLKSAAALPCLSSSSISEMGHDELVEIICPSSTAMTIS